MANYKRTFTWIIKILRKNKIPFQITGGFAAKIYGSKRKIWDIDIDIPDKYIKKIALLVSEYISLGPKRIKIESFDVLLIRLKYYGCQIDISGADSQKVYNAKKKKWRIEKTNIKKSSKKIIYGIKVPIIPIQELISYKRKLNRKVDLEDLKQLYKKEK